MPFPLISASPPSALRSSMARSAPCALRGPGSPRRRRSRSAGRRGHAPGLRRAVRLPRRSTRTRKSLPAPWCLVSRSVGASVVGAHRRRVSLPPRRRSARTLDAAGRPPCRPDRRQGPSTRYGDRAGTTTTAAGRRPGSAGPPRRPRRRAARPPRGGRAARGSRAPAGRSARGRRAGRARRRTSSSRPDVHQPLEPLGDPRGRARPGGGRSPTRTTGVGG